MPSSLSRTLLVLPGKTDRKNPTLWLPAWLHMADTANVMERLYRDWLPDTTKHVLAQDMSTELDNLLNICKFLGMVHDIGKLTPVFTVKLLRHLPEIADRVAATGFTLTPGEEFIRGNESPHALAGEAILLRFGSPKAFASIVGAHHGKPVKTTAHSKIKRQMEAFSSHYYGKGGRKSADADLWKNVREEWLSFSLDQCGLSSLNDLPDFSFPAQMLLTGLLIMADWIASNPTYFPLISVEEDERSVHCAEWADKAWKILKLPSPWHPRNYSMNDSDFARRFGGNKPRNVQRAVMEKMSGVSKPGILIMEAQMGVGKTEAALAGAEILASRCGSSGLFFGLPTRATANGLLPRVRDWAAQQAQEQEETLAIRLLHGSAAMNDEYRGMFHGTAQTEEDSEDGGLIVHEWFEGRKQALLSDFVVGTVDHLLLAALKQKHIMLRHLGLAGKVVIVDECHAYDAYMDQYLFRALQWLGVYGTPVILLSATLPSNIREHLMDAYLNPFSATFANKPKDESTNETWRKARGYPRITWSDGRTIRYTEIPLDTPEKKILIRQAEDEALPEKLRQLLSGGGCAGVLVNTVGRAQELWTRLKEALPDHPILLLHAHFTETDRAEKEREIMRRIGKDSTPEERRGLIVVGTQVLEQSLDIDFDVLFTDLCPMDLLLQRMGRLHRHKRVRPELVKQACCHVLHRTGELEGGAKAVYGVWLLERTKAFLPETVTLPQSIPELVEKVYAEPDEAELDSVALRETWEEQRARITEQENRAKAFLLKCPELEGELTGMLDTADEREGEAAVRDGDACISVIVMVQYGENEIGFLPWRKKGNMDEPQRFQTDCVPDQASCFKIAREQLRLPARFGKKYIVENVIAELDKRTLRTVQNWVKSPGPLNRELFLLLEERGGNLETSHCGWRLRYNKDTGLTYEKEKQDGEDV